MRRQGYQSETTGGYQSETQTFSKRTNTPLPPAAVVPAGAHPAAHDGDAGGGHLRDGRQPPQTRLLLLTRWLTASQGFVVFLPAGRGPRV